MTTYDRSVPAPYAVPSAAGSTALAGPLAIAVLVGLALGVGDLLWQLHVPYPWAGLANSSAVWAVAAFGFGALVRVVPPVAAVAAVVMELVAVEAYYLAAVVLQGDTVSRLWSAPTMTWLMFGVVAGVVWGPLGAWFRSGTTWQAIAGLGAVAGVLLGEGAKALYSLHSNDPMGYLVDARHTAEITVALGLVAVLAAVRRPLVMVGGAVAALPVALVCAAAFTLANVGS